MVMFRGNMKSLVLAGVAALVAAPALAADILPPPPPPMAPVAVQEFSGWYIRGDVGVGVYSREKFRSTFDPGFVVPGLVYEQGSLSAFAMLGLGAGYQFNSWLRADVTAEIRGKSRWNQVESYGPAPCGPAQRCVDLYKGRVGGSVFLANGYFDLGTWYNVTPYVGVGLGMANNQISQIVDNGVDTGGFGTSAAVSKWGFAWALMAGASFNIAPNWKLDAGYRYLHQGSVSGGRIQCQPVGIACGFETHKFQLASHNLRIGLRYMFGDSGAAPAPVFHPAPMAHGGPLVRKY